jgi:hypothetical protein
MIPNPPRKVYVDEKEEKVERCLADYLYVGTQQVRVATFAEEVEGD